MPTPYEGWRWRRPPRSRPQTARIALRVLVVEVVLVAVLFVVVALRHPFATVRDGLVHTLVVGVVGLSAPAVLAATALLAGATVIGSLAADQPEQRVLVDGPGGPEPALRFVTSAAWRWAGGLALAGIAAAMAALRWWFPAFVGVGVVMVVLVPAEIRTARALRGPDRVDRAELTRTHLLWYEGGRRVAVGWTDVVAVDACVHEFDEVSTSYVDIRVRPGAAVVDGRPRRRRRPEHGRRRDDRGPPLALAIPVADLAAYPPRLYWACVAFRDPRHRDALLAGAELVVPWR